MEVEKLLLLNTFKFYLRNMTYNEKIKNIRLIVHNIYFS